MDNNVDLHNVRQVVRNVVGDIHSDPNLSASEYLIKNWEKYTTQFASNQNINGKVFEELIAICLIRAEVMPFYMQAKVAFIPNVNYDFIVYTKDIGPISLSAKTSLRERWKQADLEAIALKYIHRKSESYVLTMEADEVRRRRVDSSQLMGIDSFVLANTTEIDELIANIKKHDLGLSPKVEVVSSSVVITPESVLQRYN